MSPELESVGGCGMVEEVNKEEVLYPGFFEGPEKLLEIVFKPTCADTGLRHARSGLRLVPRHVWEDMLQLVQCEVVSVIHNANVDAYMLSESSMFVFPTKLMIKTCGSTTLLLCVERLLSIASEYGLSEIKNVFYSRKNFLEPARQPFPHSGFESEVEYLERIFGPGKAQTLGALNGDHWHLFILEGDMDDDDMSDEEFVSTEEDQTLEILMHDLDQHAIRHFYRTKDYVNSREATKASGVSQILPGATVDDLVFDPCGYSSNALLDDKYFTIHVTPQPNCSYASFETNVKPKSYQALIAQVLEIFKPGRFTITMFKSREAPAERVDQYFDCKRLGEYVRNDKSCHHFGRYNLLYCQYARKKPS